VDVFVCAKKDHTRMASFLVVLVRMPLFVPPAAEVLTMKARPHACGGPTVRCRAHATAKNRTTDTKS
jgi:hypothetical protein